MTTSTSWQDARRQAGWLPDQEDLEAWLAGHRERVASRGDQPLHPVITEFERLIETDPVVRLYLNEMLAQVPHSKQYRKRHVQDLPELLRMINEVLTMAPEFGEDAMVMTPLGAILDWASGTPAGFAAFRDPRINQMLGKILTAWCQFLDSPDSRYVLNDSPTGWKSEAAQRTLGIAQFQHDPDDEYWGFRSWNDFFTRRFVPGQRPVAAPDDDRVIGNACESTPYRIATDVQRQDRFWIKRQPYSLADMLAGDPSVDQFVGGTVYQAFLSATNYHRWHSPVAGTVVRAFTVPGTYYSEADSEGAAAVEPRNSQSYLAHVAARAVIVIEADNPAIGQVAFLGVGMIEVSSCQIRPDLRPGYHLAKGDELGHFQFGGSTHCVVFRPGVISEFALPAIPQPHLPNPPLMLVNSALGTANA